ncbi:D-serine/D-alanine/glycine transporter [Raoultella terrigena]|uniref:D-serine/D-alanine/glycine transporter n=1 Tax=Raoultella terrigena TaxID=577 RepID=A0A3P8KF62_RAOTE|nr:D-serine/D-alanine/glycine transporter [Raoultella terrigena]
MGFFTYMVMRAMGEVAAHPPGFTALSPISSAIIWGRRRAFYLGWTYWLSWVVTCIADVVVCGSYMQYWFPEMSA